MQAALISHFNSTLISRVSLAKLKWKRNSENDLFVLYFYMYQYQSFLKQQVQVDLLFKGCSRGATALKSTISTGEIKKKNTKFLLIELDVANVDCETNSIIWGSQRLLLDPTDMFPNQISSYRPTTYLWLWRCWGGRHPAHDLYTVGFTTKSRHLQLCQQKSCPLFFCGHS